MTQLQTRAIDNVLKTSDKLGKAMVKAGYSVSTSRKPKVLTNSNAWKQVMQKYLPDDKLFRKHDEALDAIKHVLLDDGNMVTEPDHSIRLKAVDMAYKLKGRDNGGNVSNTQVNIVIEDKGFIPLDNVLGYKPTLKRK